MVPLPSAQHSPPKPTDVGLGSIGRLGVATPGVPEGQLWRVPMKKISIMLAFLGLLTSTSLLATDSLAGSRSDAILTGVFGGNSNIGYKNSGTGNVGAFNGSTGNVGAYNGKGNASATSGNNNVGAFNGNFNSGRYNGNNNVGAFNGNLNSGHGNGNSNIGFHNGSHNGGSNNGNHNYGNWNGNNNGN
jgi:hypothetical protein